MYCIATVDIERYYKYLFTPTSILKCNFTSRLWFEMSFFFSKAVIILYCFFLFVLFFSMLSSLCWGEAEFQLPPFLLSLQGRDTKKQKFQVVWRALITQNPKDACFHVHGSYGAVFFLFFRFIHRYMYFCVVGFLKTIQSLCQLHVCH